MGDFESVVSDMRKAQMVRQRVELFPHKYSKEDLEKARINATVLEQEVDHYIELNILNKAGL